MSTDSDDDADAPDRNALASDRTMLASERTLAAWWRTAIAALAGAVGLVKVLAGLQPFWLARAAASVPILLALLVLFMGARRYRRTARRIEAQCVERVPQTELWLGTGLLAVLASAVAVIIWLD